MDLLDELVDDALLAVLALTWLAACVLLSVYPAWWCWLAGLLLGTPSWAPWLPRFVGVVPPTEVVDG